MLIAVALNPRIPREIAVAAWDGQNTQPEKPTWNLMGMMNNPWFRVKVRPRSFCLEL